MDAKIFSFLKLHQNSVIPSVHIARYLGQLLEVPLSWDGCGEHVDARPLDVLIIIGGAFAFAGGDLLGHLGNAIVQADRVVWVQNDFTVIPPKEDSGAESPFRKAFRTRGAEGKPAVDFWTTVQDMTRPGVSRSGHRIGEYSFYANWNALSMTEREIKPIADRNHKEYMVYYGSMREYRVHLFDKYFRKPSVPLAISCPSDKFMVGAKGVKPYIHPLITHVDRFTELLDSLSEYGLSLYLEDKKSSTEFHSPANRFYEALSAGTPMVFPPDAMRMMEKAGYEIGDFVLWQPEEAVPLMEEAKLVEMQSAQRELWFNQAMKEREALSQTIVNAWSRYQ